MQAEVKITVDHQPFADQINSMAAHFLFCLICFRSKKLGGSLCFTPASVIATMQNNYLLLGD